MISPTEDAQLKSSSARRGLRDLFHSTFGNATKDERLNAIRYKAGFVSFLVTYVLTFAVLISMEFVEDAESVSYKTLLMIPLMGGLFTNMIYLWIKRYPEAVQEVMTRGSEGRRSVRTQVINSTVFMAIGFFAGRRLFPSFFGSTGLVPDIVFSCLMGVLFGLIMWWELARTRKKNATARENSKV
ncbi:MAG: hypothetical protein IPP94_14035 [Ignavibacteria bacterium]|nr:hypothetical protein [Ignavibacteria bacterium]